MAGPPELHSFAYVETDIPAGMTIREWRAQRAADRAARAARRPSALGRRLTTAVRTWLRAARHAHRAPVREVRA